MTVLVVAVVLVAALCLLDLLLTFGVIRRLKQQATQLQGLLQGDHFDLQDILPVGSQIGDFDAVTVGGERVSGGRLTGNTVVAFFSTDCGPCKEALPGFVETARETAARVLAVVVGDQGRAAPMAEQLGPVAQVVVEELGGQVSRAFGANSFPGYCVVDASGRVIATGPGVLRQPLPAIG
ncbi:TlpA disulfide reductase family protein [Nonomuraea sp. NPDC005650]|uniref:TlpA disulfide reductase family protein n=1 Tax=Nonomuraea sp. NPDC005650 TaxID=3157045 RepID=UPI0033A7C22D